MKVGIIGCGSIGSFIARWLSKSKEFKLTCVFDIELDKAERLAREVKTNFARNIDEFLKYEMDIVVESASQQAVFDYAEKIIKAGKDLIVLSVGAFANEEFYNKIRELASKYGRKIYIPSGALAGVDAISSLAGHVEEVKLTTRKNPASFNGKYGVLFEGNARDAVKLYPRNLNVAATLGLAVGFDKVKVKVIAEDVKENIHEVFVKGKFGEIKIVTKNKKMEENPRTSYLAAFSVIKILKDLKDSIVIF